MMMMIMKVRRSSMMMIVKIEIEEEDWIAEEKDF